MTNHKIIITDLEVTSKKKQLVELSLKQQQIIKGGYLLAMPAIVIALA